MAGGTVAGVPLTGVAPEGRLSAGVLEGNFIGFPLQTGLQWSTELSVSHRLGTIDFQTFCWPQGNSFGLWERAVKQLSF